MPSVCFVFNWFGGEPELFSSLELPGFAELELFRSLERRHLASVPVECSLIVTDCQILHPVDTVVTPGRALLTRCCADPVLCYTAILCVVLMCYTVDSVLC